MSILPFRKPAEPGSLEAMLDEIGLCPNAGVPVEQASLSGCADGMLHCGICGKPVLNRFGSVSLHGERDRP